ncbi:T9SS type A sorting domain-containing protein [Spirosoma taeanense]|uniref:T9SS type A sorting domain-containing protein n=1 Tax=Spirosoma taeanense TaxID=2735870 RepID=A0A6M5Y5D3_9BACT|nr:M4 family metallopeptidase [Spirosoma taeanense]QJW88421.1 T9SS type A sorting domain-containing protein [Spirosoma taeanense]
MKASFLLLTLLTTATALGQQSSPSGFARKHKTGLPSEGLAERLGAKIVPVPTDKTAPRTLLATGGARLSVEPLRLRVVRDSTTGLPVYIERKLSQRAAAEALKNRGARVSATAAASATYQFIGQVRGMLKLDKPESSLAITRTETDDLGQTHVRLMQTHRGLPVYGSELVAHLTGTEVTLLNGRYRPVPADLVKTPKLALAEASARAFTDVRKTSRVRTFGDNLLNMSPSEGELCVFPTKQGARLAYQLTVRPNLLERWEYMIDALTGEILDKYNHTCSFTGLIKSSAKDLHGTTRSFQTYQQDTKYYLIDATRPMFNATNSKMPNDPVGAIWTTDARNSRSDSMQVFQISSANNTDWSPTAVSAHYSAGLAYDYYRTTFNRNGLNGNGGTIISVVNVTDEDGKGLDNAYWNGKIMAYGNGRLLKPFAGALDIAGHEMTHGVIQNTANLQYKDQSGAINESMADVFGVMIDRDDWGVGEDIATTKLFPSGVVRNMANPNQGGKANDPNGYQPATMAQYVTTTEDNGGVHINSGIANFAFYKFATAVGKEKAEKVYYRALTTYLVRTSQFLDLRLAVIKATADLFGTPGAEVTAAQKAFDAVGIMEDTQTPPDEKPEIPVASGQDLLLLTDVEESKLYSTNVNVKPAKFDPKTNSALLHRPSVTDDGQLAFYVSADKRIRAVNLTGVASETIVSNETIWDNVAISKDGSRLAALTADKDGSMYIYSFAKKKWAKFKLYNPTYTEGVSTGEVEYADSFEWDFSGQYVVYDAFNALNNPNGDAINYWDVGFINVWDNKAGDFAKGNIEKLFANLDEGESVGNPSFAKNSSNIIAFDYFNESEDIYYVVATDLSKGDLKGVYRNNTLGFPSYSRLDNKLVFNTESDDGEEVSGINLGADKLSPAGEATVLYTGAKWPVWYTQATRALPTKAAQTITFDAIDDRYTNQGDLLLRASCSSNLPVSFVVRSGPATLSGNTLKFTGAGTVTVRAYQDGNNQFYAATPVDQSFTILTVTALEPTWTDVLLTYPNPASTTLTVELPSSQTIESLTLRTSSGAVAAQSTGLNHQRQVTLDVSQLPKGLYLLQIQTPGGTATRKILKE